MKKIIILLAIISIVTFGCGKKDDEVVKNELKTGICICTRYEEAGGEDAESTVFITVKDNEITSAYSTLKFESDVAFNNVCEGLELSNQYSKNKVDYECSGKIVKFLDYFQVSGKNHYTYDELSLDLKSIGFDCNFTSN